MSDFFEKPIKSQDSLLTSQVKLLAIFLSGIFYKKKTNGEVRREKKQKQKFLEQNSQENPCQEKKLGSQDKILAVFFTMIFFCFLPSLADKLGKFFLALVSLFFRAKNGKPLTSSLQMNLFLVEFQLLN